MEQNSEGKASPGSPFRAPPAVIWNNMVDAGRAFADSRLDRGAPARTRPRPTDLIKLRNSSGADRAKGEILKIDGTILTEQDAESIWLDGAAITTACRFGVLKEPSVDGEIGECQVSGVCLTLVNVTDASHAWAIPVEGEHVLQSGDFGTVEILYAPAGVGEHECVIRLPAGTSASWYQCVSHPFTVLGGGRADSNWIDKVGERFTAIRSDYVWAVPLPIISSTGAQKWAAEGEDIDWNGRDLDTAGAVDWSAKTIDTWGVTVNLVKIYFGRGHPGDKLADGTERRTDFLGTVLPRDLFMAEGGSIVHKPGGAMVNITGPSVSRDGVESSYDGALGSGASTFVDGYGVIDRFRPLALIRVPGTGTYLPGIISLQNHELWGIHLNPVAWLRYERMANGLGRYIATPIAGPFYPMTCCQQCLSFEISGAYPTDVNHRHVINWDHATQMGIGIDWTLSVVGVSTPDDPFTVSTTTGSTTTTTTPGGCIKWWITLISEKYRVIYRNTDTLEGEPCNGDPISLTLVYNGGPYASMPATITLDQCSAAEGFSVTCGDADPCNPGTTSTSTPSTGSTTTTESTPTLPPTTTTTTAPPTTTTTASTTLPPTTTTTTTLPPCNYDLACVMDVLNCEETNAPCAFDAGNLATCQSNPNYLGSCCPGQCNWIVDGSVGLPETFFWSLVSETCDGGCTCSNPAADPTTLPLGSTDSTWCEVV